MFGLGFGEIVVIMVIALIFFGPDKLPEVARTLGKTVAELRRAMDDIKFEMAAPRKELEAELRAVRDAAKTELLPMQPVSALPSAPTATDQPPPPPMPDPGVALNSGVAADSGVAAAPTAQIESAEQRADSSEPAASGEKERFGV